MAADSEVQMRARRGGRDFDLLRGFRARLAFELPLSIAVLAETALRAHRQAEEPRFVTFERLLARAILQWSAAPKHRDPVFERDGWRCAVPGCSSRRNLHDHHLVFRSQGGGNQRDNRITVCAAHHLHGIHAGIVRASGLAPAEILWEMPGARLLGDRDLGESDVGVRGLQHRNLAVRDPAARDVAARAPATRDLAA